MGKNFSRLVIKFYLWKQPGRRENFSIAGFVKAKQRNRMRIAILQGIIGIREFRYQNKIFSIQIEFRGEMLEKLDFENFHKSPIRVGNT